MAGKDIIAEKLKIRQQIEHKRHEGEFWKPCPGTGAPYYCCGYQILSPITGCGMYCSYCVLQVYFEHEHQVVYSNFSDLEKEVRLKMRGWGKRVVRFGTGEFADSLFSEPRLHVSEKIAAVLDPYKNVLVEFKTKSAHVSTLRKIANPGKVVIGFSMNTPYVARTHERGTASLARRLDAMRACEDMGFWISLHFDPMIHYPDWEKDYRRMVDRIFSTIRDPERIAWWSLGGFRTTPALKKHLRERRQFMSLFSGEMIPGSDGKLRYIRPIRASFYRAMQEQIEKHYPQTTLYLCMESRDVWEEAGMIKRIPKGLVEYLDRRAEKMLGIDKGE